MPFATVNPTTGELVRTWPAHTPSEVDAALDRAVAAQRNWGNEAVERRGEVLRAVAAVLRARAPDLARTMAVEMGKPLAEGEAEARKCAWVCEHYAEHAAGWLAPEVVRTDASASWVQCDPLGVILAIMPWNFPLWQVFRFAAPAWMAGNGVALKHAPSVQGCAEAIAAVCDAAGLPDGLLVELRVEVDRVEAVIGDPRVAGVTFTGSTRGGAAVARAAGAALKKTVLELGGSDPFVVLADADVDRAAEAAVASRLLNCGQSCIAAKRWIAVRAVAERFEARVRAGLAAAVMGDPLDAGVTLGPMARRDLRDALHAQVRASVAAGAACALGGEIPDRPGWFYPPTLLTGVGPGMPAWDEELFGPVAALRVVEDAEEALAAANDTAYGLGASVWTADTGRAAEIARRIDAGAVFFNGMTRSDPRLPFGGVKRSGWGRELGRRGLLEFVNAKTVWVA